MESGTNFFASATLSGSRYAWCMPSLPPQVEIPGWTWKTSCDADTGKLEETRNSGAARRQSSKGVDHAIHANP
jgi:hypothetical protein